MFKHRFLTSTCYSYFWYSWICNACSSEKAFRSQTTDPTHVCQVGGGKTQVNSRSSSLSTSQSHKHCVLQLEAFAFPVTNTSLCRLERWRVWQMLGIEPCLLIMFRWLGKFSRPQTTSQKVALLATASGFVTLPHSKTPVSMRVSYMTPGETD